MDSPDRRRPSRKEMVQAMLPYAKPDLRKGLILFGSDYVLFALGMAVAVFAGETWLRVIGSVFAGMKLNGLYTVGHDAGHNVLTPSRRLNRILALLCYMPALFNFRLWHHDHQVIHHVRTNGPQIDVYRPMSLAQYQAAPWWRRAWERLVRSANPFGFAAYITYHSRFEQSKFFPHKSEHPDNVRKEAWPVAALVLCYLGVLLSLFALRNAGDAAGFIGDVFFALLLPFFVFMNAVAIGVYLQHTHPSVPWFLEGDAARARYDQAALTVNFRLPGWLDALTHGVMSHQAHHVLPAIPCYRLKEAQARLAELLGADCIEARPRDVLAIFRACKLYDFEQRRWLDFAGRPMSRPVALPGA